MFGALALAGQASAANSYNLNLWGASAQFQLYNQTLATFLAGPPYNCAPVNHTDNGTLGITQGLNCDGAGDTITVRASSKASFDGVLALQGKAKPEDIAAATFASPGNFCNPGPAVVATDSANGVYPVSCNPGDSNLGAGYGDVCDYHFRIMYSTTAAALGCFRVDLALSDVFPPSFTQDTNPGTPVTGGNARKFSNNPITAASLSGFNSYNPMIVPFGFYAHTDVTYSTCAAGANSVNAGDMCTAGSGANSTDCPQTPYLPCTAGACVGGINNANACASTADCPTSYGACVAAPLSTISRIQAILIFTRQVQHWQDLGLGYSATSAVDNGENVINACYRVAGSGTLATLDYGIVHALGFDQGSTGLPTSNTDAWMFFNDGTGAEMNCVNNNLGAIGFADSDQALAMNPLATVLSRTNSYPNVMALKYEGVEGSRRAIRNGEYDNFFSKEWVFQDPTSPTFTGGAIGTFQANLVTNGAKTGLVDQLSTPSAINATDRRYFWAAFGETNGVAVNEEMFFMKDTDQLYPHPVSPANPQNP